MLQERIFQLKTQYVYMFVGSSSIKIRYVDKYVQVSDQTVFSLFAFSTLIHYNERTLKELQMPALQIDVEFIKKAIGHWP